MQRILPALEAHDAGEVLFAQTAAEKEALWFWRRRVGEAVKAARPTRKKTPWCPRKVAGIAGQGEGLGREHGRSICYGHAGDGNLHINILRDGLDDDAWNNTSRERFARCSRKS